MFQKKKRTTTTTDHKVQRPKISGQTEAVASSAQQRIYMHENLYFSGSDLSVYNSLVPLQIKRGSVSIEHIRLSLASVIQQHTVLRTAIRFNPMNNQIEQNIQPFTKDLYSFQHSRGVSTLKQLDRLLMNESIGKHFDVENGKVLRCHVVQRSAEGHNDSLQEDDLIIFVVHHIAFDLSSYKPFLKAFERACWANEYQQSVLAIPQYIDFALYEQALLADTSAESKMNKARRFWANLMHGYDWDKIRHLIPNEDRTDRHHSGRGYSTAFTIDQDVVDAMMLFASTNNVTMFSLSLACYYTFLFKLTNHDDDLCVVSSAANRPEKELQDMIAPASFAQARIWLDERIRFDPDKPQIAIYNMPFVYRLQPNHTLSIKQLRLALHLTVNKHPSLHTSLHFDIQKNLLMQRVITHEDKNKNNNMFSIIETTYETDEQLNEILHDEKRNPHLFDLAQGLVFQCHLVYHKQTSSNHLLSHKDLLIFNFHHALFDFPSMEVFHHDLNQAYTTGQLLYDDNTLLRYLDYAVIEQQMSMTGASMFWLDALHDCKLDQPLSLPYDRYRLSNEHRTGRGTSIYFDFSQDLSHAFLTHVSSNSISLEHLTFAVYFTFLFKLTNGQTDLCLAMNINNNRYKDELKSIIGLFENIMPLRCQLDPHWCFHQVLEHVREITTNSMKYSYFPLQRILDQHPHISKHAFLDTSLEFLSHKIRNATMVGDSQLVPESFSFNISGDKILSASDFSLSVYYDMNMDQLSCKINASLDLFNRETVEKTLQRFHFILNQVSASIIDNQMNKPIYELSLILSNERYLMQSLNNTQVSFSSPLTCIHHEFVYQVMKHPQKLAVELDEQSLTYCELLHYVQILSFTLLNEHHVLPGEVVCQCVERSLSMVIGIMGIEMAGGVYCPLSPRDPQHRLHALTQQTQSRLILVHDLTKIKLDDAIISLDIDSVLRSHITECTIDVTRLSKVTTVSDDVAYIIFTSGSTGIPKMVQVRHENFTCYMYSFVSVTTLNKNDVAVQMARSTFDVHLQQIVGVLLIGATVVMLRARGMTDFNYLADVLYKKQITYLNTVPVLFQSFFSFLSQCKKMYVVKYLRSLCSGGEAFSSELIGLIQESNIVSYTFWNLYGPAEMTITSTFHLVDTEASTKCIPIGRPVSNYRCMIMNQYSQQSMMNIEGELFVGGAGVFAGYLGRDDLTAKALIEIDGQLFYRTGDLVRMNNNGLIYYQGRKDQQIKLHGQRIELGEIERCLLNIASISACVVMKWNDDYLVAYVQSSHGNEEQLHQHCQSHLPPHMIPSIFTILEKLPLNQNGKIDRKQLPSPHFSSTHLTNNTEQLLPTNDIEISIHRIWCEIFKQNQISTDTNMFNIGGHSLLMMQLFHRYKIKFHLETNALSIVDLFQHPTIIHHAQLIQQSINTIHTVDNYPWSSLHLIQARASFAQERIYLDEQIRFSSKTAMNNMYVIPLLYRISSVNDNISITRLHHAFQSAITKHNILRTALYIDDTNGHIIQHCLDANIILDDDMKSCKLRIINVHNDDYRHMNEIITEILNQYDLFDLSKGRVIRCHILRHSHQSQDNSSCENDDLLTENDHILFSIHHAMFDGASRSIFLRDLFLAYQSNGSLSVDDNSLNYIDYSVYEHIMDMSLSREFWHSQLERYNMKRSLSLPVDRQSSSTNQQRSGLASITEITFDNELCTLFLNYASSHHLTLFQLGLSIFYVFLFKLTHGESDLCISSINANRYRNELQNIMGMFVSTLPYRVELDPHWSFDELVISVREKCLSILEHSHYPLQHILGDNRSSQSNVSFLETMFDFITVSKDMGHLCLGGANLERISLEQSAEVSKFDFSLTFEYNPLSDNKRLSCNFVCSHDLFEKSTISQIAQRFQYLFEQVVQTQSSNTSVIDISSSINKLSLILPEEAEEIELVVIHRLENIVNEAPASFAQARIWLDERIRFDPDKPQIAIYNMPFVYRLQPNHTLSIQQLHHALHLTVNKHPSLHTSLHFDTQTNLLMQRVITHENRNNNNMCSVIETTYETDEQLNEILHDEKRNPHLFDLAQGLVFQCHLVYHKQTSSNHLLSHKDLLIFNFHHALFDFPSMEVFHHDLNQAYTTGQLLYDDSTNLRYLDYAVIEQEMSMTGASMFWLDVLHDCKLDQPLSLPFDRYRLSNEHRTGRGVSISFNIGQDLSHAFLIHASSNNISLEQLALATYYVFLFKLTNGEKDLCIGINTHGRYRDELNSIIGMFVNAIPLRCQLDPHLPFYKVIKHVQDNMINCMKFSYFPLQRILNQHPNISNPVFLDTSFEFISPMTKDEEDEIMIGDHRFSLLPFSIKISDDEIMSKFDFILSFQHDLNLNEFSCTINASLDLFNAETICIIAQRLHIMLHQQFTSFNIKTSKPIHELSLILSNERYLMQSLNNTQVSFSSPLTCIHHEFVCQVMKQPQKLAVELDEQSLTYCELLHYVQILSLTLLNEYHVLPGEIVCQCVERSLSMVIGIMGIEMAGGVYCPLSPRDPQHRLHALTQQTQSRLVLIHHLTKTKFDQGIVTLGIDSVLNINNMDSDMNYNCFSSMKVKSEKIAYIIFTSGSTGTPKAVQVRHKNFIDSMHSLTYINSFNKDDTVVQMTRCSFDIHVQEILGALLFGCTVIMLHPRGMTDFDYLSDVFQKKQITYLSTVPSLLQSFFIFIEQNKQAMFIIAGGPFSAPVIDLIVKIGIKNCIVWNLYGPAETTVTCTGHHLNATNGIQSIAIGRSISNYRCMIINEYLQSSVSDQEGELLIGGVGVFAGYLRRDDLTAKALVEIDGQLFYRTGDLVTIDNNGLLHYQGRKDHQIKLHGQRIELGEIERCLLSITSISACVVIKWKDDHLVAYIQSSDINEQKLHEHCQSHLPPHMIPSFFVILDKLPLNQNGKVDRKQLPSPDFSLSTLSSSDKSDTLLNQFEERTHTIWCQVLHSNQKHISGTTSFFSVGGHSLLFIELYHHYQSVFNFDAHTLSIAPFLQQPTICQHSQLLQTVIVNNVKVTQWCTLHINEGIASFAQERIFLDEQVRFSSDIAIYNEVSTLQVVQGSLSLDRLLQAFRYVLNKHRILRTSLIFSNDDGILKQCITNIHKTFTITMNQTFQNDNELQDIIYETTINPNLFDLSTSNVFHAEILKHQTSLNENENNSNKFIVNSDILLIGFHHVASDRASFPIFFNDLCLAYNTNAVSIEDDDESLQYIDYSIHERLIDMTTSREFWYLQLEEYNLEYRLLLPVDRHRLSNDHRSSSASVTQVSFDNEISQLFVDYASLHHVTPFQLGLSVLYAFLFKLTHGDNDLCISSLNANRYRNELQNIMGMFVSTLPYRIQIDPQWSFDDLVKYVQEKCLSILEHSHYPLQHILSNLHINQSNVSFFETMYDFITISSHGDELSLDGASLKQVSSEQSFEVAKFDFMLMFVYNPMLENNRLSFRLTCSHDLFDEITVTNIGRRLEYCFQQLFSSHENMNRIDTCFTTISKINLILSEETQEMEDIIFCRQSHIMNEAPASFAQDRLCLDERIHFISNKSEIAKYNIPFLYRLHSHHTLSVQYLRHALELIVTKHQSLRTSLIFHTESDRLMQQIIDMNDNNKQLFTFIESTYETDEQLNEILHDERRNLHLFDLDQGLIFRCHLVYYKSISSNDLLSDNDLLIFNFHHALFDFPSMEVFLHDLNQAYTTGRLLYDDDTTLRYLDYAVIEQQMSMTGASMFWFDALHDCKLDQSLSLLFDRYRLANEHRTGRGTSLSFDFGQDLPHDFFTNAISNNISLEHLTFAVYFIFLSKLTNGQTDLCLAMNINNNRYRDELKSIIGLFENVIPLRCQLDPRWSFQQLLEHVREITTNSMKYSYFPLQHILNQHPNISEHTFLNTSLEFKSCKSSNATMIGDSQLVSASSSFNMNDDEILSASDFSLSIHHDLNINQLSCTINASVDLFNKETVEKISQRFHCILHQLSTSMMDNQINKPIHELSIILSNEQYLMQSLNNTQISFSSPLTCIHHEFVYQVMKHPQKLAVELDEQSLTYCELLYYVQVLSLTLLNEYHVVPGEVVCQCVERSLSMVIGIMGIEMAGGVYCPLSPRDPQHRLHALTKQTQSRLVLGHWLTKMKFNSDSLTIDIQSILISDDVMSDIYVDRLSSIKVKPSDTAYIIFTSGSTGIPKAVQIRHKNFIEFMYSLIYGHVVNGKDTILQIARCSYDAHVQDIMGTFMIGSSLIMLHPGGIMDFDCLANVFKEKNISCITTVPTIIQNFFTYLQQQNHRTVTQYLRSVCSADQFSQSVFTDQEGEFFVGGVGVFAGYLGRHDLTAKALLEIDGQLFYRTGDLVTMDNNGFLHFQGRKDHQIKLHGQRIELGEIERCLLNITSISACVVIKWNDDYLVAYVQSSHINEQELRQHCQSHLPPHMIPSIFIILEKLPLNQNGKLDRKLLPPPEFSSSTDNRDDNIPRNTLEEQLQDIFSQAFHIESPHVDVSFGQLGGTSLDAILALTLIRQQVCNKVDIGFLFNNPSIRQLAQAIEPLLVFEELQETASSANKIHETDVRLTPSFVIESLGIVILVCQWLLPIMIIHQWCSLLFPIIPICHLLFYVICLSLLSPQNIKDDTIFSWNYYRWWFLNQLWNNNTFWLQHILGTPLYNYYLRLCGARVNLNAHIHTITIDAPWLLDIGDGTWIADKTTLNSLYFNDNNTFTLHSIRIGCYCSISARSILFDGVDMQDNVIVQPMSSVTGFIASRTIIDGEEHKLVSPDISVTYNNRSLSIWHKIYQVIIIISLICIHCTLLAIVYNVYLVEQIPLPISIAFCWTLWSIIACFVTLFLLKFVVGSCAASETYPIASWLYLHKVWLRQLIVSSFHHAWLLTTHHDQLYPFILRWLGAQVEDDVKLGNIDIFLSYPTNLLKLETGVTSFGYVLLVPTEMTLEGDHRVDCITLGSHTNLGNFCSILPGSHLASHTMVGNLTRITRETNSNNGDIFIGVPARAMPFQMPIREAMDGQIKTIPFWMTCFSHYISKCLLISIYWSCGLGGGPILHTIIVCSLYRWYSYADDRIIKQITRKLVEDHQIFVCSFLGNTQWLIHLFRIYGANIGNNVILPDFSSIFDYNLVTIGDHVRLNINAHIVCHTFEQRILKLVPVTVGNSCVLMSGSIVMPGCKLMGNNRLYPFTLVMKNDLLQLNTQWKGLPAQSYVAKPILFRSAPVCDDVVKCQQKSENFDRLSSWYEKFSNIYTNVHELQFMNWGYADLDEHIDDSTGYYSKKLYQQVLADVTLTAQNILEVSCGRGAGAAWCVRTYAPRSYVGIDPSQDVINLCEKLYSTIPQLSFMIADPKTHLSFENESMDVVLSIETTNIFDEIVAVKQFVNEVTRVLTPNGYFLWCGLCNVDGSSVLIDYLTANDAFIIGEKVNITRNVLHALDIQSNSRADFIDRYMQPADQEYCRLLAGLPGTQLYDNMQQGRAEYWRAVFCKKTTKKTPIV
ncbi:unnamed protein product [Adineta steineri]|uniref:Carrier domain-containing protein n=5 Tax=Adineta steineri TaxID=433720 RepID=A0A818GUH7_9BILA|nr:unnamed protein product [Adineta steineri]